MTTINGSAPRVRSAPPTARPAAAARPAAQAEAPAAKGWAPKAARSAAPAAASASSAPSLQRLVADLRNPDLTVSRPAARALAADQRPAVVELMGSILRGNETLPFTESVKIVASAPFGRKVTSSVEQASVKRAALAALEGRSDAASAGVLLEVMKRGGPGLSGASGEWRAELRDLPKRAMTMLGARTDPAAQGLLRQEALGGGEGLSSSVRGQLYDAAFAQAKGPLDEVLLKASLQSREGLASAAKYLQGKGRGDLEAEVARRLDLYNR